MHVKFTTKVGCFSVLLKHKKSKTIKFPNLCSVDIHRSITPRTPPTGTFRWALATLIGFFLISRSYVPILLLFSMFS